MPELKTWRRRAANASFVLVASLLLGGCSSGFAVRSDSDPNADFSRYTTWNFFDQLGIEGGYNSPIYGEHFRAAIKREMSARGYRLADNPDLLVNVTIRSDDKVKMRSYTQPYMSGAYYHRPGGAYYGSGMGVGVGVSQRATEVTEASVFVDLVDNDRDRIAGQGVAVIEASDKVAQHVRDAIYTSTERIFELYPPSAGK